MQEPITNSNIIRFLKEKYKPTAFVDGLKIKYRSLISPFISLLGMVKPGEKVGDVGCGSGQFLLLVSHFAKPSYLYGIEITQRLIDNANSIFAELPADQYKFEKYDGVDFPKELTEMDVIFLIDVLHHVPKKFQESFLAKLAGVMKPGARLVLKDINASSPFVYCNKVHDIIFAGEIGHEMKMEKVKTLLQNAGLQITEQTKRLMYVYPHYTLVAKK